MKRLICVLVIFSFMSMTVFANPNMQGDVGNINVPMSAPTVDGNISTNEGWSEGVYAYKDIMATFGNTNDILQSFYLYYAYDSEGIYYAADILDNTFILSTGEDDIDNKINDFNIKNENVYGYNGDIFTFVMDPLGLFLDAGYLGNTDYNAWYSVGIFEGDVCRMYRGHNRSGDITDEVKVQGHATDEGWCFEAFIPWEFICQDAEDMSFAEFSPTVEDMTKNGAKHRAMAIYMDRFLDPEAEEVVTFQRFATCGYLLADGLLGYLSSGVCLKAYGITLTLESTVTEDTLDTAYDDITVPLDTESDTTEDKSTTEAMNTTDLPSDTDDIETTASAGDSEATDKVTKEPDTTTVTSEDTVEKETVQNIDSKETDDKTVENDPPKDSSDKGKDKPKDSSAKATSGKDTDKSKDTVKDKSTTTAKATTKSQNTSKPQGVHNGSAQTFDMGVAVAIGGVVIAVIAFIFIKKKM